MVVHPLPIPEPRPSSAEWLARDEAALAGVLPRITDVVAVRGEGSWLVDADGRRYLDFGSGIAVTNTGHCHPTVVAAITEQAATLIHTSVVTHPTRSIELAERLGALCPFFEQPQVFFCNSGAEAVDGCLKLGRKVTGRPGVIAFRRAFHGRTLAATSLTTAKGRYREGYEPLLPSVYVAPYGGDLDALDELLELQAVAANIGVMIVEPVLGEGGYVVPPVEWLAGLRERCDRHGILLVFDEVQCGVGRTGRPFAAETFGVTPDVILFAKGIASGLPLGGIIAPRALMGRWPTGAHGSTFGGNPVSCAAALATLDVLEEEGCYERTRVLGERALMRLRAAAAAPTAGGVVVDVRGAGLMIGVELADKETAEAIRARCLEDGLIVLACGPGENVLRLIPPLTITDEDFDLGLSILTRALAG
ncbi:MAG TPA: aminotransferase class III-fold pyridoxal phosphate-dependent enzyme [Acidimicrobiia bacterium]|nr:aminotransferase class III-fold pyridoxal phosphate-dependent enzyme [Acidimicrobiia bacterium]